MRLLTAGLAVALVTGCADLTTSDINATDRGVFIPSGRVGIGISPKAESPSVPHTGHALELGASGGSGDDQQEMAAGERPVVFGGRTFNSPVAMRHEFDFRFYELAYRYRHFFGQSRDFGIEALGGLAYAQLDLTVDSGTQRASEKLGSGGVLGGFGLLWNFRPTTSLQSRVTLFVSGQNEDVSTATRFDVYVAQALGRHAALRAGWGVWNVRSIREANDNLSSLNSPIHLRFSGPALGLDIAF